jgi:hypothetical protein
LAAALASSGTAARGLGEGVVEEEGQDAVKIGVLGRFFEGPYVFGQEGLGEDGIALKVTGGCGVGGAGGFDLLAGEGGDGGELEFEAGDFAAGFA